MIKYGLLKLLNSRILRMKAALDPNKPNPYRQGMIAGYEDIERWVKEYYWL